MEECKLTKRPCRAAIKESVGKCRDAIALRDIYQIVELIRKSMDDIEFKELSDTEHIKALLIRSVLRLGERETGLAHSFVNGLEGIKVRREK